MARDLQSYMSEQIIDDHETFRSRLEINQDLYDSLRKAGDLTTLINASKFPKEKLKFSVSEVFSKMNGIGQLAFASTVATLNTGWSPSNLELIQIGNLNLEVLAQNIEAESMQARPEQSGDLLGIMAANILELLIYPNLKIAYADGDFSKDERRLIIELWTNLWGYRKSFVKKIIEKTELNLQRFTYKDFAENIGEISKIFPEINFEETRDELVSIVRQVIQADGFIHPNEQKQLDELIDYLHKDTDNGPSILQVNNFWDFIFRHNTEKKDLKVTGILKKIPLFEHLTSRELKTISRLVHIRNYMPGEYFFQKGQPGAAMFIIKSGKVNIVLPGKDENEILLASLTSGTFLGELALLDNSPRSASARAEEPTEALAFFRAELNKLLKTYPVIGSKILKKLALIIGQRLKATNEQLYKK